MAFTLWRVSPSGSLDGGDLVKKSGGDGASGKIASEFFYVSPSVAAAVQAQSSATADISVNIQMAATAAASASVTRAVINAVDLGATATVSAFVDTAALNAIPPDTIGDPFYSQVVLLNHFNASAPYVDFSASAKTFAANSGTSVGGGGGGNKLSWGSDFLLSSGATNTLNYASSTDWEPGVGNYTIEFQLRLAAANPTGIVLSRTNGGAGWTFDFQLVTGPKMQFRMTSSAGVTSTITDTVNMTTTQWYAFAVDIQGGGTLATLYRDGASVGTPFNMATTGATGVSAPLIVLADGVSQTLVWVDELRITKGRARYGGTYGIQSAEFPNTGVSNNYQSTYVLARSSLTAGLSVSVGTPTQLLAVNAAAVATLTPALTTVGANTQAANAATVATLTATLANSPVLAAAPAGLATATSAVALATPQAAAAAALATATPTLQVIVSSGVAAIATSTATLTAGLSLSVPVASATASVATLTSAVSQTVQMAAATNAAATLTAPLSHASPLAATPAAVATLTATISQPDTLAAATAAVATLTPALSMSISLATTAVAVATGSLLSQPQVSLAAAAQAVSYSLNGDPYFANVQLLLHFDGANASTTFTDSSSFARVPVQASSGTLVTSSSMFGTASLSGGGVTVANDGGFTFGTGDFTLEFFAKGGAGASTLDTVLACDWFMNLPQSAASITSTRQLAFRDSSAATPTIAAPAPYGADADLWSHYAVSRVNGFLRIFKQGQVIASGVNTTNFTGGGTLYVGYFSASNYFGGFIDEVRITKGIGRYDADFAIPTSAYPNQAATITTTLAVRHNLAAAAQAVATVVTYETYRLAAAATATATLTATVPTASTSAATPLPMLSFTLETFSFVPKQCIANAAAVATLTAGLKVNDACATTAQATATVTATLSENVKLATVAQAVASSTVVTGASTVNLAATPAAVATVTTSGLVVNRQFSASAAASAAVVSVISNAVKLAGAATANPLAGGHFFDIVALEINRTVIVPAEVRSISASLENRSTAVVRESRTLSVVAETTRVLEFS